MSINKQIYVNGSDYRGAGEAYLQPKLLPGVYKPIVNPMTNDFWFEKIKTNYDNLIDLPNTEYDSVIKEFEFFLTKECKDKFNEYGFLYKRSTLLYGEPGTGKTSIVNRLTEKVIQSGGIVLFVTEAPTLIPAFKVLDDLQPDDKVMVVFEEFDSIVECHESLLLNILDGEIQKNNIIYVATTNFIKQIPPRIRRPGRFSSIVEVKYPSAEARSYYLTRKLPKLSIEEILSWTTQTEGLSIDELKETVLSVMCLNQNLDSVIKRIKENRPEPAEFVNEQDMKRFNKEENDTWDVLNLEKAFGAVEDKYNKPKRRK